MKNHNCLTKWVCESRRKLSSTVLTRWWNKKCVNQNIFTNLIMCIVFDFWIISEGQPREEFIETYFVFGTSSTRAVGGPWHREAQSSSNVLTKAKYQNRWSVWEILGYDVTNKRTITNGRMTDPTFTSCQWNAKWPPSVLHLDCEDGIDRGWNTHYNFKQIMQDVPVCCLICKKIKKPNYSYTISHIFENL